MVTELYIVSFFKVTRTIVEKIVCLDYNRFCKFYYELNLYRNMNKTKGHKGGTVEPRFNEVARDRPNLFVKSRVRYIENLDITNLSGNEQNVRYIEVIVND